MSQPQDEEIPALGRSFTLGYLYDIRRDAIINQSLWDYAQLKENINSQEQPYTNFTVGVSDTVNDKSSLMDISASIKMSFLGGLINVAGSAAYLQSKLSSSQVTSVTARWQSTVRTDRLSMDHLQHLQYPDLVEQLEATHVISGITYGADAYFSFEKKISSGEDKKQVSGDLSVKVNSIPSFEIEGSGSVKIDDNEKKAVEEITCTFYGDFSGIPIPTNYVDAIKVLNMLKTSTSQSVPVKVNLTPLNSLSTKAQKLVSSISGDCIDDASNAKIYIDGVVEKLSALELSQTCALTSSLHSFLEKVKALFLSRDILYKEKLMVLIPNIRGGTENQQTVFDLVNDLQTSKFSNQYFSQWFSDLSSEVGTMDTLLTDLNEVPNIHVIGNQGDFAKLQVTEENGMYVVNVNLASMVSDDVISFLEQNDTKPANYPVNSPNWVDDSSFFSKVLQKKEAFKNISVEEDNSKFMFVFKCEYGSSTNDISVDYAKNGSVVDKDIDIVSLLEVTSSTDDITWTNSGSVEVQYKLVSDSSYTSVEVSESTNWKMPTDLPAGQYDVRVRKIYPGGAVGSWQEVQITKVDKNVVVDKIHLTGHFECHKYDNGGKNDYHYVTITVNDERNTYTWLNRANVEWNMYPTNTENKLTVGTDCPYYKSGYTEATFTAEGVLGPWDELYSYERSI